MACVTYEGQVHTGYLVGRPDGKSPLGRPSCMWDDTIKMDHQEVGWGGMYCTVLA